MHEKWNLKISKLTEQNWNLHSRHQLLHDISSSKILTHNILHKAFFTLTMLWANSADDKLMMFFLFFPRKEDLTLHANCLPRRQFAWNVKSYFQGKIIKVFKNVVVCWNFYPVCKASNLSALKTNPDACADSVDPDKPAHDELLIRIYTVCHSV